MKKISNLIGGIVFMVVMANVMGGPVYPKKPLLQRTWVRFALAIAAGIAIGAILL